MRRRAFTLVELLVVIAIIGVMVGMLLPAVQKVREVAARAKCSNSLKQLGLAGHAYADVHGAFPYGMWMKPGVQQASTTFMIQLLPFVEQDNLYRQWDFNNPQTNTTTNPTTSRTAHIIPLYLCPSDTFKQNPFNMIASPGPGGSGNMVYTTGYYSGTSYAGNYGTGSYFLRNTIYPVHPNGIFFLTGNDNYYLNPPPGWETAGNDPHNKLPPIKISDILDGTGSTLMIGEKSHLDPKFDRWTSSNSGYKMHQLSIWAWTGSMKGPAHIMCSSVDRLNWKVPSIVGSFADQDKRYGVWGSGHPGGVNFVLCDGSVKFISERISAVTLIRLSARADGQTITQDY